MDGAMTKSLGRGKTGPSPTDRGKTGVKRSLCGCRTHRDLGVYRHRPKYGDDWSEGQVSSHSTLRQEGMVGIIGAGASLSSDFVKKLNAQFQTPIVSGDTLVGRHPDSPGALDFRRILWL